MIPAGTPRRVAIHMMIEEAEKRCDEEIKKTTDRKTRKALRHVLQSIVFARMLSDGTIS
jgi:hypothetical protein